MRKATISKYFIIPTPAFFVCKVNPPIKLQIVLEAQVALCVRLLFHRLLLVDY